MILLPDGTIRVIFGSLNSGESWIIFDARLYTSAACSFDMAPLMILVFSFASGPTICASSKHAIVPVLPFLRAMLKNARRVPAGLS